MTSQGQSSPVHDRIRLLAILLGALFGAGFLLRIALYAGFHDGSFSVASLGLAILTGIGYDALALSLAFLPLLLVLSCFRLSSLANRRVRWTLFTMFFSALIFNCAAEFQFFDEFNARYNHIALDYVLFPGEVFVNIWESYNVPLYVGAAVTAGALLAWPAVKLSDRVAFAEWPASGRIKSFLATAALAAVAVVAIQAIPKECSENRIVSEIAQNGLTQLGRAFFTANLDYSLYYKTTEQDRAERIGREYLGYKDASLEKHFCPPQRADGKPLDVVVILEESLGSEFVGLFGNKKGLTPSLDRWSKDGILCTNLVANGNRTVRGLEAVLCSFLSLPPDSIVKRNRSQNVASIARVLRDQGYRSEFFYGGAGSFDNMKPFMMANGYDDFIEDGLIGQSAYPKDAFRTAWGVADEYIFDQLLAHQQRAEGDHHPFFGTVMSVSNHKPFLVPPGHGGVSRLSPERIRKYTLIGISVIMALTIVTWLLRRRLSVPRLAAFSAGILAIYGCIVYVKLQPKNTRDNAVAYSDWALGRYLDQAKAAGVLDHTVVLIVGDHGARVYGSQEIPAPSYRIPALFVTPDGSRKGNRIERLCSQIDLAPTLLGLAGIDFTAPFFGDSLLDKPAEGGRAFLNHNRDIGLLTDDSLVVLGLQKTAWFYRRPDRTSDQLELVEPKQVTESLRELEDKAIAVYQLANEMYLDRRYTLPEHAEGPRFSHAREP